MGAHFKAYLNELATLAVNMPGGIPAMRGTFAVSKYVAKAMLIRRWNARLVWGMQRQAASQIMATVLGVPMLSFVLVRVPAEAAQRVLRLRPLVLPVLPLMMDARTSTIWIRWI